MTGNFELKEMEGTKEIIEAKLVFLVMGFLGLEQVSYAILSIKFFSKVISDFNFLLISTK